MVPVVQRASACQTGVLDPQSLALRSWSGSISGLESISPSLSDGVGASAAAALYTQGENKLGNRSLPEP